MLFIERQRETKRTFSENKKFKRKEARKKEERKVTEIDKAIEDMRKVGIWEIRI